MIQIENIPYGHENAVQRPANPLEDRKLRKEIERPVYMEYTWYERNKRRDLDNISSFGRKVIQDALVQTRVLVNDGWNEIVGFSDQFYVDAANPRIEVLIREVGDDG